MTQPEQQATGNTPAATPLDYAGPTSARPLGRMPTMLEWFVILGIVSLLIVILLPSHNGRRINSTRGACAANLRSAGQAIQMYASDHGGRFPDTLGQLIEDEYILDVRILLCPACADTPAQGPTPAARAADLTAGGHLSYVYVGRGLTTTADPYTVVMYEHPAHHKGVGGNVLYADGHCEWLNAAEFRSVVDWHAAGNGPMVRRQPVTSWAATRPVTQPAQGMAP